MSHTQAVVCGIPRYSSINIFIASQYHFNNLIKIEKQFLWNESIAGHYSFMRLGLTANPLVASQC